MPRIGMNPLRNSPAPHNFSDVVLTVITHLPVMTGYHAQRFEVVKACLNTMRENAGGGYDVIVWDNGSCDKLRHWLQDEYAPAALVLSENIGKSAARLALLGMVTPETIVNISDDDMLYAPDWLSPQLALLRHYPQVSCVSGYPVRTSFRWANAETKRRLQAAGGVLSHGRFISERDEYDFAASIGRDWTNHCEMTVNDVDTLCEYKGVMAYATSHHCQHIGVAGILRVAALNTLMNGSMPDEKPYDIALDALGNRLATTTRLVRHIGNVML